MVLWYDYAESENVNLHRNPWMCQWPAFYKTGHGAALSSESDGHGHKPVKVPNIDFFDVRFSMYVVGGKNKHQNGSAR